MNTSTELYWSLFTEILDTLIAILNIVVLIYAIAQHDNNHDEVTINCDNDSSLSYHNKDPDHESSETSETRNS